MTGICATPEQHPIDDTTCDGRDDDCDGLVDEDFSPSCDGAGVAECVDGVLQVMDCGDGDLCNGVEGCDVAECTVGTAPVVDDGNECTADSCDPVSGVSNNDVASGIACTDGTCDGAGNCIRVVLGRCAGRPMGASCSDGDRCNGKELCDGAGACLPGNPPANPPPYWHCE